MNIINIEHISKTFGDKVIFEDASFGIHEGDKVGIIGINGTGKSTLLKMIAGQEMPDSGQIVRQNGLTVACLPQNPVFAPGATVMSYIQEGGVEETWLIQSNLSRLGMAADETPVDTLSGGQKRKLALARLLAEDFNVLLLDEPTNHLDNEMIAWLEDYLRSYKGVVLMVTHDRYFLDRVSKRGCRARTTKQKARLERLELLKG